MCVCVFVCVCLCVCMCVYCVVLVRAHARVCAYVTYKHTLTRVCTKKITYKHGVSCVPSGCGGWLYKNICLRSSTTSSNSDNIPSGCNAYQPSLSWGYNDYVAICQHFGGQSACTSVDYDSDGGRCSNFRAILAYEHNHQPNNDVWVSRNTFAWTPVTGSTQSCSLMPNPPGTVVYACR